MQNLSIRLKTIASLVPYGARVCDIGTDHGYLAIYLKNENIAKTVIAADINEKPLENARQNIEKSGTKGIELRLCNGLAGISKNETDTVIIAGMGSEVITGILERGAEITENKNITLIIQPTTSPELLRKFLCSRGYEIIKEIPVSENNKLYSVMLIRFSGTVSQKDDLFYYIGKIPKDNEIGIEYIKKQEKRFLNCAKQLENVSYKADEYAYYKNLLDKIKEYLR